MTQPAVTPAEALGVSDAPDYDRPLMRASRDEHKRARTAVTRAYLDDIEVATSDFLDAQARLFRAMIVAYRDGVTFRDIAKVIGRSPGWVQAEMYRHGEMDVEGKPTTQCPTCEKEIYDRWYARHLTLHERGGRILRD